MSLACLYCTLTPVMFVTITHISHHNGVNRKVKKLTYKTMLIGYNKTPIMALSPPKKAGAKNVQNSGDVKRLQTLIVNISGTDGDIQNRKTSLKNKLGRVKTANEEGDFFDVKLLVKTPPPYNDDCN